MCFDCCPPEYYTEYNVYRESIKIRMLHPI